MVDIEKAIEQAEKDFGRQLTDKEKQMVELFGGFMNVIWDNNQGENHDDSKRSL